MQTRRNVVAVVTLCSLVAAWLLPDAAASEEAREAARPHAEMALGADHIDWQPAGDYEQVVLTVAGPEGLRFQKEFADGQPASLSLFDPEGNRLPDGAYIYELRLVQRKAGPLSERPALQAGSFVVRDGSFATPFETAKPAKEVKSAQEPAIQNVTAAAEVIADDLVVQGGACIGDLCGSGDATGVLKLKDYTVGIVFEDVFDNITHFRDWALQANPSIGGSDHFFLYDLDAGTIPFAVWGNSPDYSLVVGSGGKIGIGTAIPAASLHVNAGEVRLPPGSGGAGGFTHFNYSADGKNYIRGTTVLVDIGGKVGIGTASPDVLLDVKVHAPTLAVDRLQNTSGSGYSGTEYLDNAGNVDLFFGVDNAASTTRLNSVNNNPIVMLTNSVEHVRIDSDGDVGINCNNPTSDLVIASGSGCSTPSSSLNAGSTSFTVSSSRTIKENLAPVQVPNLLDKVAKVGVFRYDFIQGPKDRLGLMAEDFHQIFERGPDKVIDGQEVQMALWLAVQELTALNKELREQNLEIRKRLADVEAHLPVAPQQ